MEAGLLFLAISYRAIAVSAIGTEPVVWDCDTVGTGDNFLRKRTTTTNTKETKKNIYEVR